MKKLFLITLISLGFCLNAVNLKAQNTIAFEEIQTNLTGDQDALNASIRVLAGDKILLIDVPASFSKVLKNTNNIKAMPKTFVLKHKSSCYEFKAYSNNCNNCVILWKDRNGDGKVQPKKELKAVCKETRKPCNIKVRKVKC